MSGTEEIEVKIGTDGKVELAVRGVSGPGCLELTQELEQVLGGQVLLRQMTSEAQEPVVIQKTQPTVQRARRKRK
jgi:hypothetical protein